MVAAGVIALPRIPSFCVNVNARAIRPRNMKIRPLADKFKVAAIKTQSDAMRFFPVAVRELSKAVGVSRAARIT